MGEWGGRVVVYKLWDTFQSPDARERLQQEWNAYHALKPLQVHSLHTTNRLSLIHALPALCFVYKGAAIDDHLHCNDTAEVDISHS